MSPGHQPPVLWPAGCVWVVPCFGGSSVGCAALQSSAEPSWGQGAARNSGKSPLCCLAKFIRVHVGSRGSVTGSGVGRVQDSQAV